MRSERLALIASLALSLSACDEKQNGPAPERFASVKKTPAVKSASFCEKTYASGERKYVPAASRAIDAPAPAAKGWRWVNVWATWCQPCVEEMALLKRWSDAFHREGLQVSFELLSIDDPDSGDALEAWRKRGLAGPISLLRAEGDFPPFLEGLGIDKSSAIPIHALVDPGGSVRCVRVGAIHEQDYGAALDLIASPGG